MTCQRDFMQKLRVGVVGLGGHAYRNVLPTLHNLPVKLAALCDVDADLLARTEAEYRTGAAFTDAAMFQQATQVNLDAVLLCTVPRFHPALTLQAFAAGLDVWMEKPPAMRAAQIETLLAARGDRVCAVGFKKACMSAAQSCPGAPGPARVRGVAVDAGGLPRHHPARWRAQLVFLTERGRVAGPIAAAAASRVIGHWAELTSPQEIDTLRESLLRLLTALRGESGSIETAGELLGARSVDELDASLVDLR